MIRAAFFYRENADYLTTSGGLGKARRYGGSINFRKDFDKLSDIFRKKKKLPVVPPPSTPTAITILATPEVLPAVKKEDEPDLN